MIIRPWFQLIKFAKWFQLTKFAKWFQLISEFQAAGDVLLLDITLPDTRCLLILDIDSRHYLPIHAIANCFTSKSICSSWTWSRDQLVSEPGAPSLRLRERPRESPHSHPSVSPSRRATGRELPAAWRSQVSGVAPFSCGCKIAGVPYLQVIFFSSLRFLGPDLSFS